MEDCGEVAHRGSVIFIWNSLLDTSIWNSIHLCGSFIDIQGRSQDLRHFYSGMGLKLGVFLFSNNLNNRGLSGANVTCIYCSLSVKINMRKMLHRAQRSWAH